MENVLPYNRFSLEVSLELLKSMDSQVNLHSARVCVCGGGLERRWAFHLEFK